MTRKKYIPLITIASFIFLFLMDIPTAMATHNRAGEITYVQTDALAIDATVTIYTKASSISADRDTIEICWGDGTCSSLVRANGPISGSPGVPSGEILPNDIKKNEYKGSHVYPGLGHYELTSEDPNRNGGICNVNFPFSLDMPFFLRSTVTFFDPIFQAFNSSPILTQPPIDIACVGQPFFHNPGAFDPDGDSLAFVLAVPLQSANKEVEDYQLPPEPPNTITINPVTGNLIWASPHTPCTSGEYNVAFWIIEYRNGIPIDTMLRDMQIRVVECNNLPPQIEAPREICVIAGELVEFDVTATAPISEPDQLVNLTALGGPFELGASFDTIDTYMPQPLTSTFRWQTTCNDISNEYYQVIFRSADNFPITIDVENGTEIVYLSTLFVVRIKVVGPPPEDLFAEAMQQNINLSWEKPYDCEFADGDFFKGFTVWRKINSNTFPIDTCTPGLDGKGYTKITPAPINDALGNRYVYTDVDLERGRTYCYRILAEFADTTLGGFSFNEVESLPSDEFCLQLSRDVPLIIQDSVMITDVSNGQIKVKWTKPDPNDLDTLQNLGPYVYELQRAVGFDPADADFINVPGGTFTSLTFAQANDTVFFDSGLNTQDNPYTYRLAFYVNNESEELGFATPASSVFASVASTDETNNLSWEERVPWDNYSYTIYRWKNTFWDSIGVSMEPEFSETGLTNGVEYCYRIESTGTYGIPAIESPLFNMSQDICGTPIDTIPPCPPVLIVDNLCKDSEPGQVCEVEDLKNELSWTNPNVECADTDDVVAYRIYYKPTIETPEFTLLGVIGTPLTLDTFHYPEIGLAGCYAVTAIDTFFNESAFSNIECVDNCPFYELPNAFTPNGDGDNELFIPYPYCFISSIDMKIFNRWGQLVFETTDPNINWDGTNQKGQELAEGPYFYTCQVFEDRVSGVNTGATLSGYIELVRGNN